MAVFHFVKLRHNVTVFTRDDPLEMGDVINPYFWKGFRWVWMGAALPLAPWARDRQSNRRMVHAEEFCKWVRRRLREQAGSSDVECWLV